MQDTIKELPLYLSGSVLKKSNFLGLWNKRTILIDLTSKILTILSIKSNKQLNLIDYTISQEGLKEKKYYVIKLVAKSPGKKNLKYQQVEFATLVQIDIMLWFENISLIMSNQFKFQVNKQFTVQEPIQIKSQNETKNEQQDTDFNEMSMIEEKKTEELFKIPFSNYLASKKIYNLISDQISQFVSKSPFIFQEEVLNCLNWVENDLKIENFDQQIVQQFIHIFNKKNINIFQNNQLENFRSILSSQLSQQEIYEIILLPRVNHSHPMLANIEIMPSDLNDGCAIVQADLLFQTPELLKLKTIFYHSYSFQYQGAFFVLCKTLKFIEAEDVIDSQIYVIHKIIQDPLNPKQTLLITDANYKFKGENQDHINDNTIQFLQNMIYVEDSNEEDKGKFQITVRQNQENLNISDKSDSSTFIDVKYNYNSSFSIVKEMNWIQQDSEQIPTKENLIRLLDYIDSGKNLQICMQCKHELESKFGGEQKKHQTTLEGGHFLFKKEYRRNEQKGGLIFQNFDLIEKQRKVIFNLLKRVGSNILQGKSLMNISLPVHIFEKKSFLQRMGASFGHIDFLEIGGNTFDIVEQLKYATCFLLSSFMMSMRQEKPFNPVLGETMQGRLNGHPIYFEQVSHHPPVMCYMLYGGNYKLYGAHASEVSMGANTCVGTQKGQPTVYFNNTKLEFKIIWNSFTLYGTAIGQRYLNCMNRSYVYEPKSRLCCEIIYNPHDKGTIGNMFSKHQNMIDEISGAIYQVKKEFIQNLEEHHKFKNSNPKSVAINPQTDIENYLSKVSGIWHSNLSFDNKEYWNTETQFPHILTYEHNLLPSDSMFRHDILWLNMGDLNKAQEAKEKYEVAQRNDQHLRKQLSKKK